MPKQQFSKLPVSVIKHIKGQANETKRVVGRDPRFQNASGSLNQGLFAKSYAFVKDLQNERFETLKNEIRNAGKIGDTEAKQKMKDLLGEEKSLIQRQKQEKLNYESLKRLKEINKERVLEGKQPHFSKKRDLKESQLREKFDDLEKKGRLDSYMQKMAEPDGGKRRKY